MLEAEARYYVEIVTSALEGERFDIDFEATANASTGTIVLDLTTTSFSTLGSIPDGALVGARCVVRPHLTLDRMRTMFTPELHGHRSAAQADAVKLFGDRGMEVFYLGADGESWFAVNGAGHGSFAWRFITWLDGVQNSGGGGGDRADYRHLVVPPDVSFVVDLARTGKRLTQRGLVRTSAFRKNLVTGRQSFATGFPVALAPAEVGARDL